MPEAELTPDLRRLRLHERALGLDTDAREAMRLDLEKDIAPRVG
jgi:hypothetical protein